MDPSSSYLYSLRQKSINSCLSKLEESDGVCEFPSARRASQAFSDSLASPTSHKYLPRYDMDEEAYSSLTKWIKTERGKEARILSRTELLDIVAVQGAIRHEAYLHRKKNRNRSVNQNFAVRASKMLRRKVHLSASMEATRE